MRHIREEERQRRNAEFLKGVVLKYPATMQFQEMHRHNDDHVRLLLKAAVEPGWPLGVYYSELGLHGNASVRAKDRLCRDGLCREVKMTAGRGGTMTMLEVSELGCGVVSNFGVSPTVLKGKGSFKHKVYVHRYLARFAKSKGYRFWIEKWFEPKAIDFVYADEYSHTVACEVCISGAAQIHADAGKRCASFDGIHHVLLACEKRPMMIAINNALKKELPTVFGKSSVVHLGDYWIDKQRGDEAESEENERDEKKEEDK